MVTLDPADHHVVPIDTFTVEPSRCDELLAPLSRATDDVMRHRTGFVSANLHVAEDRRHLANYAQWRSHDDLDAMMSDPEATGHMAEAARIAASFDPIHYRLVESHAAAGSRSPTTGRSETSR